jgi:hypothetical protein
VVKALMEISAEKEKIIKEEQIHIDATDLRALCGRSIARVVVENAEGLRAVAFIDARTVHGRIKFTLTVKKNGRSRLMHPEKDRFDETIVHATADWIL